MFRLGLRFAFGCCGDGLGYVVLGLSPGVTWFGLMPWALGRFGFGLGRIGLLWGCFGRMVMYLDGVWFWIGLVWPD